MLSLQLLQKKLTENDNPLAALYQKDALDAQRSRYLRMLDAFCARFPSHANAAVFSTPGRTEVGGNHTDHNGGCVLAAAVDMDVVCVAAPNGTPHIRIWDENYGDIALDLSDLSLREAEYGKAISLIRGVMARLTALGFQTGGFDCVLGSIVPKGSGLSSSAAFEVQMVTVANHLFNRGVVNPLQAAQIAQYAENHYFGKPCGLMDQTACAVGGLISIDFQNFSAPVVHKVGYDFAQSGHILFIVNTGGSHADLTADYEAIPTEMKSVAHALGGELLRGVCPQKFRENLPALRENLRNDRSILRALHFFQDNERVAAEVSALENGDFEAFKKLVTESGYSSFMYNQNIYANTIFKEQGLSLALALSEEVLRGKGAWRVHGGGFGGTIQAFVPLALADSYQDVLSAVFGASSCHRVMIRQVGTAQVLPSAGKLTKPSSGADPCRNGSYGAAD